MLIPKSRCYCFSTACEVTELKSLPLVQTGGEETAIGAAAGGSLGAGSEIIIKGDQVKVARETFLDFTLQQEVLIRTR